MNRRNTLLFGSCFFLVISSTFAGVGDHEEEKEPMSAATFAGLKLRGIGPALMSGRISDIAVHPTDPGTWYVAAGSGGVWKTTNAGTTWKPIFDSQKSYSIGCITIDPNHPETIWVGSGENVGGRHVGFGDGVYRSDDGGSSWKNMGLAKTEHIGNIVVDPRDSSIVYVAAQGPLWSPGGQRGLFKTTDGGRTWKNILSAGEFTGVNEVRMDPQNPDVLYASTHQRFRNVAALIDGGPESGIHKSTDGGRSWYQLKKGLPHGDMGRIGLAISPQRPNVIYATIELAQGKGGFYRSTDGGASWEKRSDYVSGGTGAHYYQEIYASPHQFDRIYQMDVRIHVSNDGGKTFQRVTEKNKHSDNHALAFDPNDPDYLLAGCDGGLYESRDLGKNWRFFANLPITQFYKVAVDYDEPFYHVVGGTQDNSTQYGPSRTDNVHGIRNSDWMLTVFADGHQPAIDPTNPNIIYSEWQQGNLIRHDRKTGEITYLQPQPAPGEESDRFNWDSPILISPHDPARLYYASQRVWRSDDRGDTWTAISGDLSRGLDRLKQPMMGRVWSIDAIWDTFAMSKFGTVTSLAESPLRDGLIYAGTDDGLIQVTEDGGKTWRRIERLPGVPEGFFVNNLRADLFDADTVYACLDNHKAGDFTPYLLKSTDRGATWKSIVGDLPDRHLVWRIVQDNVNPDLLFVGTEFGVFFTVNGGEKWVKLTGGIPNIPVRDLTIQKRENDLVCATFGRGFYILDDYSPLRTVSKDTLDKEAELFPVRKAWWYRPRGVLGFSPKASQGAGFFVAPNPPFGAVFTYYLKNSIETRREVRRKNEKKIAKNGGDTPTPGWDALRDEDREEKPAIMLTVRDAAGDVVRYLKGPAKKGIHRVSWSLTRPSTRPWSPPGKGRERFGASRNPDDGLMVEPGTYSVHLAKRVEGKWTDLGLSQTFEVVPLRDGGTLPGMTPQQLESFKQDYASTQRSLGAINRILTETTKRLTAIRQTLDRSTISDPSFGDRVRDLQRQVADMTERLNGNPRRQRANDPGPVSISRRLNIVGMGISMTLQGPTTHHRDVYESAKADFDRLKNQLRELTETTLPALEHQLDQSGLPWTPGRGIPGD